MIFKHHFEENGETFLFQKSNGKGSLYRLGISISISVLDVYTRSDEEDVE